MREEEEKESREEKMEANTPTQGGYNMQSEDNTYSETNKQGVQSQLNLTHCMKQLTRILTAIKWSKHTDIHTHVRARTHTHTHTHHSHATHTHKVLFITLLCTK